MLNERSRALVAPVVANAAPGRMRTRASARPTDSMATGRPRWHPWRSGDLISFPRFPGIPSRPSGESNRRGLKVNGPQVARCHGTLPSTSPGWVVHVLGWAGGCCPCRPRYRGSYSACSCNRSGLVIRDRKRQADRDALEAAVQKLMAWQDLAVKVLADSDISGSNRHLA